MSNIIWMFLFSAINNYPLIPLRYLPFLDKLKTSKKKIIIITTLVMIIQGTSFIYIMSKPYAKTIFIPLHNIIFILIYLILPCFFVNEDKSKIFYMTFLLIPVALLIASVPAMIENYYNIAENTTLLFKIDVITRSSLIALLYPLLYKYIKKYVTPMMKSKSPINWSYLLIAPFIYTCISLLIIKYFFDTKLFFIYFIVRFLAVIGCLFTNFSFSYIITTTAKAAQLEENQKQMEGILEIQKNQYSQLSVSIDNARALRHDLRHQLTVISALIKEQNYEKVKEFLDQYIEHSNLNKPLTICDNYVLNSIASYYIALAEENNIDVDYSFDMPSVLPISDQDLCIIIGNSFENAIEACSYVHDEKKLINIHQKILGGNLSIIVSNNYDGKLTRNDENKFLSKKRNNQSVGFGITSVCSVIEKYDGLYSIETKDNIFTFKMMIPLNN